MRFTDSVVPLICDSDLVEWAQNPGVRIEARLVDGLLKIRALGLDSNLVIHPETNKSVSIELVKPTTDSALGNPH